MNVILAKNESLKKLLHEVNEDRAPIILTTESGETAVLISLEDFEAIQETIYLLSSKANAKWLSKSINEYESGKLKPVNIEDIEKEIK